MKAKTNLGWFLEHKLILPRGIIVVAMAWVMTGCHLSTFTFEEKRSDSLQVPEYRNREDALRIALNSGKPAEQSLWNNVKTGVSGSFETGQVFTVPRALCRYYRSVASIGGVAGSNIGLSCKQSGQISWRSVNLLADYKVEEAQLTVSGQHNVRVRKIGSGLVFTPQGHILTSAHVVAGCKNIRAKSMDGKIWPAAFVGVDRKSDIAVLRTDYRPLREVFLSASPQVTQGTKVFSTGYSESADSRFKMSQRTGQIVQLDGYRNISVLFTLNINLASGHSGGAVFSEEGNFIGIVHAASKSIPNTSYGIWGNTVLALLDRWEIDYSLRSTNSFIGHEQKLKNATVQIICSVGSASYSLRNQNR
jgi:S1-C subfamily serine protease